jgi:LysM repeat protein
MKSRTLPVKRRPVPKGIFKRLSAVTTHRKQRVAAAASADMEADDSSSKISRALTIVFLFHIVAIGLIFVHQKYLDGRTPAEPQTTKAEAAATVATAPAPRRGDLPRLSSGDKPYIVRAGDNYARIAAAEAVDESDLRLINEHVDIGPGVILKIPPKRIVAMDPPEVAAIRNQAPVGGDSGLVDAVPVDVRGAPRAQLIRPNITRAAQAASAPATASGKTYVVQNGDSVWRIANRFKVNQDALMKANGLSDARKLRGGMSLVIPQ